MRHAMDDSVAAAGRELNDRDVHPRRALIGCSTLLAATLVSALAAAWPVAASAQGIDGYPVKPIRIIVPVVAGGGLDNVARMLAQQMSERLGQPLVVENRPGAAGVIGMDAVAKAAPDGYTLLFAAAPIALNSALGMKLPYDPYRDFAPIS
ncbi:MAG: tripartite tricarboxylate transporter substrate-binding protein, partial [Lautropia sp.]